MTSKLVITGATVLSAAVYVAAVVPRLARWGATDEEVTGPYPGADLVPEGRRSPTMAVTIAAPPQQVWPWLLQLGWDRGGWYSWDLLDNAGRPSADSVHPEWQDLAVGDQLRFWAFGRVMDAYRVAVVEPDRFLGLYGYTDYGGTWLDPDQPGRSPTWRPSGASSSVSDPTAAPAWSSAGTRRSAHAGWSATSRRGCS